MSAAAANVIAFPPGKTGQPIDLTKPGSLLRECRTRTVKTLSESVSKALDTFVDELYELADQSLDRDTRDFYLKAKEEWPTLRPRLEQRFRERLEEVFDRKSRGDEEEPADFSNVQTSWSELSLVADGDLDESVRFTDIAGRIRNGADEELAALDQRMAVVLDRPHMQSHDNPLSPMAICDAFRSALGVVESGPKLKKLLIRYFDQGVRFPVPKLYAELNGFLKEHGVLPTIRYGRSKKPVSGAGPSNGPKSADSGQVLGSVTLPVVAGSPAAGGGATMTMTLPGGVSIPGIGAGTATAAGSAIPDGQDPFVMLQQLLMGAAARGAYGPASAPGIVGRAGVPGAGMPGAGGPAGFAGSGGAGLGAVQRGGAAGAGTGGGAVGRGVGGVSGGSAPAAPDTGFPQLDGLAGGAFGGGGVAGVGGGTGAGGNVGGQAVGGIANGGAAGMFTGGALIGSLTRLQHGDFSSLPADVPAAFATPDLDTASLGGGFAAAAALEGSAAPARNVLHALKGTSFANQLGQMDTVTLDIVAMLFDQIFGDPRVPPAMKALIGRLQIPMLKVAVMDKNFFSKKNHPARHMLDTLGELSVGLGDGFDAGSALYQRIEAILQRVVEDFEEDVGIFDRTTAELRALIQDADKTAEQAARKEARRIQDRERLDVARLFAQNEVKARVKDQALPRAVLRFLATEWMKLLILAYAKGGRESRAWQSLVETMDILVWSLTPKQSTEERQRLVSVLPGLLKRLTTGMEIIHTQQHARERFNAVLMRCHAKAIGGGDAATADVESPLAAEQAAAQRVSAAAPMDVFAPVEIPPAQGLAVEEVPMPMAGEAIELTETEAGAPAKAQLQEEMRPVVAPETLPSVVVRNPFGDGSIELEEVSFGDLPGFKPATSVDGAPAGTDADAEPLPQGDEWTELVLQFKEGDWIELHEEGGATVQARLSYVSPYRGTYVFTNRKGQKIGEFSMFDVTSALRTGRMTVMANVPLFDRAFSGLVGMLRKHAEEEATA
ncbi:MAG: DUF1631 domain-containing protein [Burkholderiales bacterium]|nr:DUF1631 domain-containing protein [Burkholderiales bacterium]